MTDLPAFAVVAPGLEALATDELRALGVAATPEKGGVAFHASARSIAELTGRLHLPSQVLLVLAEGPVHSSGELTALVRKVRWRDWIRHAAPVEVEVANKGSPLRFRDRIADGVRGGVAEGMRGPRVVEREARATMAQVLRVRLEGPRGSLSIAVGGELLHRRGWRQDPVGAPIRENLAAALVRLSGWKGEPLLDPFCGSGTLPISAALLDTSPFVGRRLACSEWPCLAGWSPPGAPPPRDGPFFASDRDERAVAATRANARRAGVRLAVQQRDVTGIEPPADSGLILTNPPWGQRLGQHVEGVYASFGHRVREAFPRWRVVMVCPDERLARIADGRARRLAAFQDGGQRVAAWGW